MRSQFAAKDEAARRRDINSSFGSWPRLSSSARDFQLVLAPAWHQKHYDVARIATIEVYSVLPTQPLVLYMHQLRPRRLDFAVRATVEMVQLRRRGDWRYFVCPRKVRQRLDFQSQDQSSGEEPQQY